MPNRIIREGILTSSKLAALGWPEEVFYRRLLSVVDDFGRYHADVCLLRAACYPRQLNKVSDSDVGKWLHACADAALVRVYPAEDGERYLEVIKFDQQVRAKKSKFPDPANHLHSKCLADATQTLANEHLDVVVFVDEDVVVSASNDAEPSAPKKSKGKGDCTFSTFAARCKEADEVLLPDSDPVNAYAEQVGLPAEYVDLAWAWFKARYTDGSGKAKRYTDWRMVFRRAVKEGWPKFWGVNDQSGAYYLTTAGKQAQREAQA